MHQPGRYHNCIKKKVNLTCGETDVSGQGGVDEKYGSGDAVNGRNDE
jgi:hypothetical protein